VTLRAGLLDRRIRLERRVEETDASGQSRQRYLPLADVWARVEPLGGREGFGKEQWVATGDVRFTIRWRVDVTPLHRVIYGGQVFDVMTVAEEGRREALLVVGRARTERRDAVPGA
jgi:SPP1 family predicted phage head-tail adaptor